MSATVAILELIEEIKKASETTGKGRKNQDKMEDLKTKLTNMYNDYRKRTEIRPDFEGKMPINITSNQFDLKSNAEISTQAALETKAKRKELQSKIEKEIQKETEKLEERSVKEYSILTEGIENLNEKHKENVEGIKGAMARQGITQSSIAENLLRNEDEAYLQKHAEYMDRYRTATAEIQRKTAEMEEWKKSALLDFDLKKAAIYEDRLHALKAEQQKIRAEYETYLEQRVIEAEKFEQDRKKEITKLEREWQKSMDSKRQAELEKAMKEGKYEGELDEEMDARYQLAYSTLQSMGKLAAKKHFEDNKDFLKENLGAYYYKLKKKVEEM